MSEAEIEVLTKKLRTVVPKSAKIKAISAQAGTQLKPLLYEVLQEVQKAGEKAARRRSPEASGIPVLRLARSDDDWRIEKTEDGFTIYGTKIEQFAVRTDFENEEALQRMKDILRKSGIMHELNRQGLKAGQQITFPDGQGFKY